MPAPELPDDYWHTYVYVHFSWLCCSKCEAEPDTEWAWEGLKDEGEAKVTMFTLRVVERLKNDGWLMHDYQPYCPKCASQLG